jgi:bifunctional non-homologous end joining protein LigD
MPRNIRPMLASLVDAPFNRAGWLFDVKWDGYRAISEVGPDTIRLYSRNHKPFESKFVPIVEALNNLRHNAVLDGEIVVLDREGRSRFQLIQNYQKTGKGNIAYYVFDLLYLDGKDLRSFPLKERRSCAHCSAVGRGSSASATILKHAGASSSRRQSRQRWRGSSARTVRVPKSKANGPGRG